MRIMISVQCDTEEEAQNIIKRLYRPKNWTDEIPNAGSETRANSDSGKKVDKGSVDEDDPHPTTRPNVDPGQPTIGKIGKETASALIEALRTGVAPDKPHKWTEHYKLLWQRGSVKYDGKEYYL